MKLTKKQLKKIIKEEIAAVVAEDDDGRIGLQKLPAMDHAGYSSRVDSAEEHSNSSRRGMAEILLDDDEYKISDRALAAIWKILEKAVRVKAQFGPEVWDIHGELVDQ